MPLGVRDIMLVIRAKDDASRVISQVGTSLRTLDSGSNAAAQRMARNVTAAGTAMMGIGIGIGVVGAAGLALFANAASASLKYNKQASFTLTQVRETGVGLAEIKKIGIDVAKSTAAPLEQLQDGLFDVFSTTDLSMKNAAKSLVLFSKAGVAGQVTVREAARGSLDILNAFRLGADDVTKVLDAQFKLVQIGKGEYKDIAGSIGLASGAAAMAGQSFEGFMGALAFTSRVLPTMRNSTAAVGRALEAFVKPKVIGKLKELGVEAVDANGKFRPISDTLFDLSAALKGMNPAKMASTIDEIFKGSGNTIQGRRFITAGIMNPELLRSMSAQMQNSAGEMEKAYQIMLKDPSVAAGFLANKLKVLRLEIGDNFLPAIGGLLVVGNKLLDFFLNMDSSAKKLIIRIALFTSAFFAVSSVILFITGAVLLLVGVLASLTGSVGLAIVLFGGLLGSLVAIPAIIFLMIKNWDKLKVHFLQMWETIKNIGANLKTLILGIIKDFAPILKIIGGLSFVVLIEGLKAALNILNGILVILNKIRPILDVIILAFGVRLVMAIIAAGTAWSAARVAAWGSSLGNAAKGAMALSTAMKIAAGAFGIVSLGTFNIIQGLNKAKREGKAFADNISGKGLKTNSFDEIKQSAIKTGKALEKARAAYKKADRGGARGFLDEAVGLVTGADDAVTRLGERLVPLQNNYDKLNSRFLRARENIDAVSKATGLSIVTVASFFEQLNIPIGGNMETTTRKFTEALDTISLKAGFLPEKIKDASRLTTDQLKALEAASKAFGDAFAPAFSKATSLVQALGNEAEVSGAKVQQFYRDQIKAVSEWKANLEALGKTNIDQGLFEELASAGPSAAPLVSGVLQAFKSGSGAEINAALATLRQFGDDAVATVNGRRAEFAAAGAAFGAAGANSISAAFAGTAGRISADIGNVIGQIQRAKGLASGINVGVPKAASKGLSKYKGFADGGFINSPTFAMMGEQFKRELVLPLTNQRRTNELLGQAGLGGGGGTTNNIKVYAQTNADSGEIAHDVAWELRYS